MFYGPARANFSGDFGQNWLSNWETRIVRGENYGTVPGLIWIDEDGAAWNFGRTNTLTLTPPPGSGLTLVENGNQFVLTRKGGLVMTFHRIADDPKNGRLASIVEPHGDRIDLTYDANGKLTTVGNVFTGTISYVRNAQGKVSSITRDRDNLAYAYDYNAQGWV